VTPNKLSQRLPPFWVFQLCGWSVYGLTVFIAFLAVLPPGRSALVLLWIKLVKAALGFLLTFALRWLYRRVWRSASSFRVIGAAALGGSALFGLLWITSYNLFFAWQNNQSFNLASWAYWSRQLGNVLDFVYVMFGWSALYFGLKYWQEWQAERERTLQANALAQQAQLEMLRYQLNPHFLFNALNSIRASVDEDSQRAKRMITEFSEFLRYSLLNGNAAEIPLREELAAIRNYLAIEQIRFEDKLQVSFEVEPAAEEYRLPGFLIHPLVENAIKHGMNQTMPLKLHLTARLRAEGLYIEVANSGHWHSANGSGVNGLGIGLRNIQQRLAQLFPGRSRFEIGAADGWVRAVIEINKR
jgi:two-component system, LytTR family, sensor kinase